MPIDYNKAKIYSIRSPHTDLIYIGSTCQSLSQRMTSHRRATGSLITKSKIIIEYGEAYIELLENYPCNNKEELLKKEGEHIRNNNNCCNRKIEGRTNKQYCEENKEKIKQYKKQWREDNKEKIKEVREKYYEENKEKIKQYKKQYYKNKKI